MIYPSVSIKDIQGWIPETDVDGVDAKKTYVADCQNIDFENGHIRNAIAPLQRANPTEVGDLISSGYSLVSTIHFEHSERGDVFVYILWKSSIPDLKIYLEEIKISTVSLLELDYQNQDITFTGEPTKINFNLVNDQLKINLNFYGTYNSLSQPLSPILNLTLLYQDSKVYDTGVEFTEGWYIFPRWLGWSYRNGSEIEIGNGTNVYTEDMANTSYESWFDDGSFTHSTDSQWTDLVSGSGALVQDNFSEGNATSEFFKINDLYAVQKVVMKVAAATTSSIKYSVSIAGATALSTIPSPIASGEIENGQQQLISVDLNLLLPSGTSPVDLDFRFEIPDQAYLVIGKIEVVAFYDCLLLVKNSDGQRALVKRSVQLNVFAVTSIEVNITDIDWRVDEYEIYAKIVKDSDIYYKVTSAELTGWTLSTGVVSKNLQYINIYSETLTTLNFNYGLGSVFVGLPEQQRLIYSEGLFNGRVYYVNEDKQVYQSHISGTGRIQPDSFPFDEDLQFGYFEKDKNPVNRALLISPLGELVILTNKKNFLYYVQGAEGVVYRTLKVMNGNASIYSSTSAIRELNGEPIASVMAWFNEHSIWIHAGGRDEPVDVVKATHRNYWLSVDKEEAIIFYNTAKNELWIALKNKEVLIYELSYGSFKKYKFSYQIIQYVGIINGKTHFLCSDDKVRYLDYSTTNRLSAYVETHYDTNTLVFGQYPVEAPEHETKILQELFVATKDQAPTSALIDYNIIADGNQYESIKMNLARLTELLPAPLLVRYGKVKIRLNIPATTASIREFGYTFSNEEQVPATDIPAEIEGLGLNTGLKLGVQQ
jgi:hypothetical protein